ncbi:MAG: hypothetical protein UT32_C0008G0017 [Parcubacteria group bacterium GW2011_GWC2_39_14]|nr:MAG: hypothetical protein UT32_C0008G0017 [Parcubacteria group bacterium GW2011_GWC2_39_14]KKR54918.1 MAG: hypothetical protein UT91_C0007G0019 [Parcubacteria group bacterium GW2011_GWA2_40_23]
MFDDVAPQSNTPAPAIPATPPQPAPAAPSTGSEEIHTMPMDYYTGGKTGNIAKAVQPTMQSSGQMAPASGGRKKLLNIAIVIVLVIVVGVSAYLLYASYQTPTNNQNVVNVEQPAVVVDQPAVTDQPAVVDTDVPPPVDMPADQPATDVLNFDPSKLSEVSLALMASLDKDKDGLTDAEEAIIGTDQNINDTDKDTYRDGDEMKNFYDPLKPGSVRLNDSAFAASYENTNYGYKLLYPKTWLASPLNVNDPSEVMFTSKGNEFVNVFVDTKGTSQTLDDWYLEKAPTVTATQLKKYQNYKKVMVLESPDGFTAYVASTDKVFIINYNIGLNEEASFPGLFAMMVNGFEFIPIEKAAPAIDFSSIMQSLNVKEVVDNTKVVSEFTCGSKTCFYDSFTACEAGLGIFKLTDNLTYEVSASGKEGTDCVYAARFTKISDATWAGKTMRCKYDPTKGFEVGLTAVENCTGDLASLIKPQQP